MTRGLNFRLNDLPEAMRRQVQAKLNAVGAVKTHVCEDEPPKVGQPKKPRRSPTIPKLSDPEERLAMHMRAEGLLTMFQRQYRWCPGRAYRADFACLPAKLLVEVQGGVHIRGKRSHTGGVGYEYDRLRTNEATIMGWRLLEFTPKHIKSGRAIHAIKRALEAFRT